MQQTVLSSKTRNTDNVLHHFCNAHTQVDGNLLVYDLEVKKQTRFSLIIQSAVFPSIKGNNEKQFKKLGKTRKIMLKM